MRRMIGKAILWFIDGARPAADEAVTAGEPPGLSIKGQIDAIRSIRATRESRIASAVSLNLFHERLMDEVSRCWPQPDVSA